MTIETKYNIGDEVWFIQDNKVCNDKITAVHTYIAKDICYITYGFGESIYTKIVAITDEQALFPTKEELLKSL